MILIFAFWMSLCQPFAEAEDFGSSRTSYEQAVEAAFPLQSMQRRHVKPTPDQERILGALKKATIDLIEVAKGPWFGAIAQGRADVKFSELMQVMKASPIWICGKENCPCGYAERGMCTVSRSVDTTTVTAIYLESCAFSAFGCRKSGMTGKSTAEIVIDNLPEALTQSAYQYILKSSRKPKDSGPVKAAVATLGTSQRAVQSMLRACPGPFAEDGLNFLAKSGHMVPIGGVWENCRDKLLERLKPAIDSEQCKGLIDRKKWRELVTQAWTVEAPKLYRCDSICYSITCGNEGLGSARTLQFGKSWYLSLPEGACEGSEPTESASRSFVFHALKKVSDDAVSKRTIYKTWMASCAKALVPEGPKPSIPVTPDLKDGFDMPLIEN